MIKPYYSLINLADLIQELLHLFDFVFMVKFLHTTSFLFFIFFIFNRVSKAKLETVNFASHVFRNQRVAFMDIEDKDFSHHREHPDVEISEVAEGLEEVL